MGMKDDLRKAQAAQLRGQLNKLRKQAEGGPPAQGAEEGSLIREILETVGRLEEQMEEVMKRLDHLEGKNR